MLPYLRFSSRSYSRVRVLNISCQIMNCSGIICLMSLEPVSMVNFWREKFNGKFFGIKMRTNQAGQASFLGVGFRLGLKFEESQTGLNVLRNLKIIFLAGNFWKKIFWREIFGKKYFGGKFLGKNILAGKFINFFSFFRWPTPY